MGEVVETGAELYIGGGTGEIPQHGEIRPKKKQQEPAPARSCGAVEIHADGEQGRALDAQENSRFRKYFSSLFHYRLFVSSDLVAAP